MKQTEIGLIPDDWEVKRLNAICNNISSGKNQNRFVNGIYPVYGSTGIIGFCNNNKYSGDAILVARVGANAGLVNKVAGKYDVSDNTLVIQSDKCDIDYLSRVLAFRNLNQLIFGSGQPLITGGQLKALLIQLPSLAEQQRIAKALSDVDALISTTEKLIQKKKNIKQGAMQNLLTGKKRLPDFAPVVVEPVETSGYKQTELGLIPEDWEEKSFDVLFDICTETVPLADINQKYYVGTENMMQDKKGVVENSIELKYQSVREYLKEDILISNIRPYLKKVWFADKNGGCSTDVLVFRNKRMQNDSLFLFMLVSADRFFQIVNDNAVGTKMPRGDKNIIKQILFALPSSKKEQTAIANVLSSMDKEIETLNTKLEKYRNLKTAMMQQLLTGKIRL